MIYTLTLNPCLDYVMGCENVVFGETNRSGSESISFGGKGINVSFVLKELGITSKALGFIGGFTGDELEKRVLEKGIDVCFIKVSNGNTRINVKIKGKDITEINASGFTVDSNDLEKLYGVLHEVKDGDTVVMGGSAPNGSPDNIYGEICKRLSGKEVRLVIDTTGKKLLNCLKYKPFLIKPNKSELEELFSAAIDTQDSLLQYMKQLQSMGAQNVLVSMGKDGASLLDFDGNYYHTNAHKITAVNTVGAGDSMVAGFLSGIDKGSEYALKKGNACGAATAYSPFLAVKKDIDNFMKK